MKLILSNNQSERFQAFYGDLRQRSSVPFEYSGYSRLLFRFDAAAEQPISILDLDSQRQLSDYDGVYINGYQEVYAPGAKLTDLYELAASVAVACEAAGINYVNRELSNPPSFSKLSMHAKLAAAGVKTPLTFGGSRQAMLAARQHLDGLAFPAILKRADADRGIDNFKVDDWAAVEQQLAGRDDTQIWLLQRFVPNDGYYLVSFYDAQPAFSIYREMGERKDGNALKAHLYKPKGGINASLLDLAEVPPAVLAACQAAVTALNRQIGSVDCLYDPAAGAAYVLEVNYNPQLVTIETFKEVRQQALLDGLEKL